MNNADQRKAIRDAKRKASLKTKKDASRPDFLDRIKAKNEKLKSTPKPAAKRRQPLPKPKRRLGLRK